MEPPSVTVTILQDVMTNIHIHIHC